MKRIKSIISRWLRSKRFWSIVVVIVLIFIFLISRNGSHTQVTIQTDTVKKGTLVVSLSASGQVTSLNSATVDTSATGVVKKVLVTNGQKVKAGEPILELDLDQDSSQRYMIALASYTNAKNSLASAQNSLNTLQASMFNANQKFINDAVARDLGTNDPTYIQENATWLASENAYNNQQNSIKAAQQSLSASSYALKSASPIVYAPIAGTVNGLSLTVGAVIASQSSNSNAASAQKVASIVTDANPTITLNLTQVDAPKVMVGSRATITLDAFSQKTYTGRVVSIDITGSVSSGVTSYPTVIQLDTKNPEMYPNMSATANIILETKDNVLLIPTIAITNSNGNSTVKVQKNGQIEIVNVSVGSTNGSETEISDGLSEGETIVMTSTSSTKSNTTGTSVFSSLGRGNFGGGTQVRINRN